MKRAGEKSHAHRLRLSLARLVDQASVDVILVGDSASSVMAGQVYRPMTLDHMIYHASALSEFVDTPFSWLAYRLEPTRGTHAKRSVGHSIMKESSGHAVKLEGGAEIVESIQRILTAGILSWGTWV